METGNTCNAGGLHVLRELDTEKPFLSPHIKFVMPQPLNTERLPSDPIATTLLPHAHDNWRNPHTW